MRMRVFGLVAVALLVAAPAMAQQRPIKGIVCSGPTPFHCAVFGAGFNKFYKAFKGWSPPDREVAAEFCESRDARLVSAKRRRWPGGPGNEVFVVDVTCTAGSLARPAPSFEPSAPAVATRPVAPPPRRARPVSRPPPYEVEVLYDDEPRTRRRPAARRSAEPPRERRARSSDGDGAPPRERVGRTEREAPPARETSRARAETPEAARTPEPVRPSEPARPPTKPAADASPASDQADSRPQPSVAPAAERPRPSRKKPSSYEESLTYEHF